jgi:ankyrin repeat protein
MKKTEPDLSTALYLAIREANLERVTALLTEGASANALADRRCLLDDEHTPLRVAVSEAGKAIRSSWKQFYCVLTGTDAEEASKRLASKRDSLISIVKLLLASGADVNKNCPMGGTPLRGAVCGMDLEMVRLLIASGANPRAETFSIFSKLVPSGGAKITEGYFNTVLHEAVEVNSPQIVMALLEAGADFKRTDHEGKTPLDIAREKGFTEIIEILEKHELGA